MIRFENVSVRYDDAASPVIQGVDLTVPEGELVLLVGPSGVGKSTLLGTVSGLVPHFTGGTLRGRVTVDGRDTRTHKPRELADLVGTVGQDPLAHFVTDTVEDELAYGMESLGVAPDVMRRRVEETLDLLGLAQLRDRPIATLSGGQQQRVAIGSVLTPHPKVLVLDEPTSALDPAAAEEVLAVLQRLVHDLGTTVLLAEHRLERVVQYADQVILLPGAGEAPVMGEPGAVMAVSPVHPPVVALGRLAGWAPLPLSVRDARRRATDLRADLADAEPERFLPHPAPSRNWGAAPDPAPQTPEGLDGARRGGTAAQAEDDPVHENPACTALEDTPEERHANPAQPSDPATPHPPARPALEDTPQPRPAHPAQPTDPATPHPPARPALEDTPEPRPTHPSQPSHRSPRNHPARPAQEDAPQPRPAHPAQPSDPATPHPPARPAFEDRGSGGGALPRGGAAHVTAGKGRVGEKLARLLRRRRTEPPSAEATATATPIGTATRTTGTAAATRTATPPTAPVATVTTLGVRRARVEALRRVTLTVAPGETIALMGRNGAGKSTLLSALVGMIEPTSGTITIGGRTPHRTRPRDMVREVGLVPQEPRDLLYADTVAAECAAADSDAGAEPGTCRALVAELLPGIQDDTHPRDLSEGQRLALALALVLTGRPPLLLLDEPTRGLDYAAKSRLVGLLCDLAAEGHAIVLATHDVELAADLAHRVVILADGEVVADGPTAEVVVSSPAFAPQVAKILAPQKWLTVAQVRAALSGPTA